MPRNIGETAWLASWETEPDHVVCPDCGGTSQITALLFDGSQVSIGCEGCRRGYDAATGRIQVFKRQPRARHVRIVGVELDAGALVYNTDGGWHIAGTDLFDDESAAVARAAEKCVEADAIERQRVAQKEKPTRSWSWHVHYHRGCIRRAERDIEHHKACLAVARVKAKEPTTAD